MCGIHCGQRLRGHSGAAMGANGGRGFNLDVAADNLFLSHPDPMWIYDTRTLRFLAVNTAAIVEYGYTRAEFLAMTIADIRPPEDRAALQRTVDALAGGLGRSSIWRHCLKSGELIYVNVTGHVID